MDETEKTASAGGEKRGFLSLFAESAGKGRKMPLLLLLCGAVGLFLLFLGGSLSPEEDSRKGSVSPEAVQESREKELESLLRGISGVGEAEIYLSTDDSGTLRGIAVLCEGGEDPAVQRRVLGLLTALYGIGSHRIFVGGLAGPPAAAVTKAPSA